MMSTPDPDDGRSKLSATATEELMKLGWKEGSGLGKKSKPEAEKGNTDTASGSRRASSGSGAVHDAGSSSRAKRR